MRILRDESGQTSMFVGMVVGLVLLGFVGFAVDVGYVYNMRRQAQAAADAAAMAAAEEYSSGNSITSTQVTNAANAAATINGFNTSLANNPATVALSTSGSGILSDATTPTPSTWVTAVVSQPISTPFIGAISRGSNWKSMSVSASATAACCTAVSACNCLGPPGGTGTVFSISGGSTFTTVNPNGKQSCGVTANSSSSTAFAISGGANMCASSLAAVSSNWYSTFQPEIASTGSTVCSGATIKQGASGCTANFTTPTKPASLTSCAASPLSGGYDLAANSLNSNNYNGDYILPFNNFYKCGDFHCNTLIPNDQVVAASGTNNVCYSGLDLSDAQEVVFSSGYTYFISGDFTTGGGVAISGNNVTFVVSGNLNVSNGTTISLTAPTASDGNPGVLFYVGGTTISITGGSNVALKGIISGSNAAATLNGGTFTSGELDFDVKSLNITGGATLDSYASSLLVNGAGSSSPGPGILTQ